MRILIAEDDPVSRRILETMLEKWGHDVVSTSSGGAAWQALQADPMIPLAILDWMMPEVDGVEVCRRIRDRGSSAYVYVILLTARREKQDVVVGLETGADDYVTKPFDAAELRSRVGVGERMIGLKAELAARVRELEDALAHVKRLQGILPICMHCKKIRGGHDAWQEIETYITDHTEVLFSHGVCQACMTKHYG